VRPSISIRWSSKTKGKNTEHSNQYPNKQNKQPKQNQQKYPKKQQPANPTVAAVLDPMPTFSMSARSEPSATSGGSSSGNSGSGSDSGNNNNSSGKGDENGFKPPPLQLGGFSGKFVRALFDEANRAGEVDKVGTEMPKFMELYHKDVTLRSVLLSPLVKGANKLDALNSILDQLELCSTSKKCIITLLNTARLSSLKNIVRDYQLLITYERKQIQAYITSAQPLSQQQLDKLREKVSHLIHPDYQLVLSSQINPSLLGGLKLRIGDKELDLTMASKITNYQRSLKTAFGL